MRTRKPKKIKQPSNKNWKAVVKLNGKRILDEWCPTREGAIRLSHAYIQYAMYHPDAHSLAFRMYMNKRLKTKELRERSIEIDDKLRALREQREHERECQDETPDTSAD